MDNKLPIVVDYTMTKDKDENYRIFSIDEEGSMAFVCKVQSKSIAEELLSQFRGRI